MNKQKKLLCDTKFLRDLIFSIFVIFPTIRKNKFPQIKITSNIFPAKISSRVNILQLKFATQKYSTKKINRVCSITTYLFHSETTRYTTKYWFSV